MAKKLTYDEAWNFNAAKQLLIELQAQEGVPESEEMAQDLDEILAKARGPVTTQYALPKVTARVNESPAARKMMKKILQKTSKVYVDTTGGLPKPPGALLVCPETGCAYQQYRMAKGIEYRCPRHKKLLVPKTGLRRKR